jgi:hypothetical protein
MDSVYPGRGIISKKNRKLFDGWNQSDHVDEGNAREQRGLRKYRRIGMR